MHDLKTQDRNALERLNIIEKISILARSNSIEKWDIGATSSKDLSVQVDHGESKQLKGSQRNSITIRVWNKNNTLGITSTSDCSDNGIKKAFEGAIASSEFGNKNETPEFSSLCNSQLPNIRNIIRDSVGIKKLFELLKEAESTLLNTHKSIDSVPYNGLSEAFVERLYINSSGAFRHLSINQASLYLYAKGQNQGKKPRTGGSVKIGFGIEDININECITETSEKLISHLEYQPIKTDRYLVCFSPEAFLDLIGAFSSIFNARSILDGTSLTNVDNIGEQIAVPFLSISDEPLHIENIASFNFDGEGTPKTNVQLINNGKLENLLHSEATARKFNVSPTGHARLGAKASVSPEWFVIKNSENSVDENLSHKDLSLKYVLIDSLSALHAGVKSSQGSFSLPFDGWLIENGEKKSIEAATVAGDIRQLLKDILHIEHDQFNTPSGVSPHIWVKNLSITGEA